MLNPETVWTDEVEGKNKFTSTIKFRAQWMCPSVDTIFFFLLFSGLKICVISICTVHLSTTLKTTEQWNNYITMICIPQPNGIRSWTETHTVSVGGGAWYTLTYIFLCLTSISSSISVEMRVFCIKTEETVFIIACRSPRDPPTHISS